MRHKGGATIYRAALAVLALPFMAGPAHAEPLSISDAVREALSHSPELGQAEAQVGAAQAATNYARRQWFPVFTLEGNAGYRRLENDARNRLGLSALDESPLYGGVSVDQPIYDMGRRRFELNSQKARLAAAKARREGVGETSAFNAARAYLQVLLYERLVAAAKDNLGFHEQLSADMREGVARGAMSVSERQQADERREAARIRLTDIESQLGTARNEYEALIGGLPDGMVLPAEPVADLPQTIDEAISQVGQADPAVRAAEFDVKSTEAVVKRIKADGLPNIMANGSAKTGKDFDGFRGKTNDYSALLALRWRFFDGGQNAARVSEATNKAYEASEALIEAKRDSEKGARDSWTRLTSWRRKLSEQEARTTVAKDVLYSYRAQFGIGRRSLLDVLDAQSALFSAQSDAEVARVSALLSGYALLAQANRLRDHFGVMAPRGGVGPE